MRIYSIFLVLTACGGEASRYQGNPFAVEENLTQEQVRALVDEELATTSPEAGLRATAASSALPHVIFYIQNDDDFTRRIVEWMAFASVETIFRAIWLGKLPESHLHFVTGAELLDPTKRAALITALSADPNAPIDLYTMTHSGGGNIELADGRMGSPLGVIAFLPGSLASRFRFFFNLGCFGDKSLQHALLAGFKIAAGSEGTTMGPLIALTYVQALDNGATFAQGLSHVQWACRNRALWRAAIWVFREELEASTPGAYCPTVNFRWQSATDGAALMQTTLRSASAPKTPPFAELGIAAGALVSQPVMAPRESLATATLLRGGRDNGFRYPCAGWNPGYVGECGDLSGRKIIGLRVSGVSLKGSKWDGAVLVQSQLTTVDLTDATLNGTLWISSAISASTAVRVRMEGALGFSSGVFTTGVRDGSLASSRFFSGAWHVLEASGADLRKTEWIAPTSMERWVARGAKVQGADLRAYAYVAAALGTTWAQATYDSATGLPDAAFAAAAQLRSVAVDPATYASLPAWYSLDDDQLAPRVRVLAGTSVATAKF